MMKPSIAIVVAVTLSAWGPMPASADAGGAAGAAREEAARAQLRPLCANKDLRNKTVAQMIEQGGSYERATAKWDMDDMCEQVDLPSEPQRGPATETAHSDWIYDARFSPDAKLIATAGRDGSVRLWDAASGKTLRTIDMKSLKPRMKSSDPNSPGHVRAARFLGDGRLLVVAADTHPVRIFDVANGEVVGEVPYTVPDANWEMPPFIATTAGGLLVLGGYGGELVVYDAKSKSERYRLPAIANEYPRFAVSEAAGLLVTTAPGKGRSVVVQVRDLQTGKPLGEMEAKGSNSASSLAFSKDGKLLAVAVEGQAFVYTSAERKLVATVVYYPTFGGAHDIAFTADGKKLITGQRHAQLWDISSGKRVHHFGPFRDLLHSVDVSPDGKYVITGHIGSDARIWETETGKFVQRLGKNAYPAN